MQLILYTKPWAEIIRSREDLFADTRDRKKENLISWRRDVAKIKATTNVASCPKFRWTRIRMAQVSKDDPEAKEPSPNCPGILFSPFN